MLSKSLQLLSIDSIKFDCMMCVNTSVHYILIVMQQAPMWGNCQNTLMYNTSWNPALFAVSPSAPMHHQHAGRYPCIYTYTWNVSKSIIMFTGHCSI